MSYSDLLDRMMQRDSDAFLEMTDRYGWTLYNAIRRKYPDKSEADRIYNETMQQFYLALQNPNCEDPMEALLYAWAEYVSGKKGFLAEMLRDEPLETPPAVKVRRLRESPGEFLEKKNHGFGMILVILVMLLVLTVCCWILIGFLMEQGILPYRDYGYSWFCTSVDTWLRSFNII